MHAKESKYDERCCSCWVDCETDDHLLQCPNRSRKRNEIYQVLISLSPKMDPVLHDILRDGMHKYLNGHEQTFYAVDYPAERGYRRLQESQRAIGWNNLLRGKYSTHWRRIQRRYKQDQSSTRTSQPQSEPSPQSTKLKPNRPPKRKTDVFQRVFD